MGMPAMDNQEFTNYVNHMIESHGDEYITIDSCSVSYRHGDENIDAETEYATYDDEEVTD